MSLNKDGTYWCFSSLNSCIYAPVERDLSLHCTKNKLTPTLWRNNNLSMLFFPYKLGPKQITFLDSLLV